MVGIKRLLVRLLFAWWMIAFLWLVEYFVLYFLFNGNIARATCEDLTDVIWNCVKEN